MQQLSGLDNASLFTERGNVYNHVGTLIVYDPSTAPGGGVRYKEILGHFAERLHLHPVFSNHLTSAPLGLDRPYWVAGGPIDVEYHIRHLALPAPGDWRQLMIQVARLHSRPLDRHRPLWEVYIIEGLDDIAGLPRGSFAMYLKLHHAAVDGVAAVSLLEKMHTTAPVKPAADAHLHVVAPETEPRPAELLYKTVGHNLSRLARAARLSAGGTLRLLDTGRKQLGRLNAASLEALAGVLREAGVAAAPRTRFSERVSANRVMECMGMSLEHIKRVRASVPGSTLNDVFIAVAGGAVRKYLEGKGELPAKSLAGLMPIALRSEGSAGGNQVAGVPVRVRSDIADPIQRLAAIAEETRAGKATAEKLGLETVANILDVVPPLLAKTLVDKLMLPRLNMAVSNVRGPGHDMYLAGARAMCFYPVSIPADGAGLNFTGISYDGVMWVSMVSCRRMLPDSGLMLSCMEQAWTELLQAAAALPAGATAVLTASAQPVARGGRKSRAGGKAKAKAKAKSKTKSRPKTSVKARTRTRRAAS
ncbi:MAG: wax ester/triacylglycerol synthase family O-acyltransferase [Pseudomonadales bacterium]|nr:wax ester/triacylglycerol synthase family O-acyltransferase [Pseudomonadales bacterium]